VGGVEPEHPAKSATFWLLDAPRCAFSQVEMILMQSRRQKGLS
jgi:hypothetical protein